MKTSKANERLMIVRLNLHQWYPRKYDREASEEIARNHGAASAAEVGRFNKILVSLESIKPLQRSFAALRGSHYGMTAPWADDGTRVLPADLYFEYCEMVKQGKQEIETLADEFVNNEYANQREAARTRLKTLFRESDYPMTSEVRCKFGIDYHFEPLPNPEDVRVWGIGDEAAKQIASDITQSIVDTTAAAQADVVERVQNRAKAFIDKVNKYSEGEADDKSRNTLYATAVTNLRDVVSIVLKGLNVTGDQQLAKFAAQIEKELDGLNVEQLKTSQALRDEKTAAVEKKLAQFKGVFGGAK